MLLLLAPAHAWSVTGDAWSDESLPLPLAWYDTPTDTDATEAEAALLATVAEVQAATCDRLTFELRPTDSAYTDDGLVRFDLRDRYDLYNGAPPYVFMMYDAEGAFTRNGRSWEAFTRVEVLLDDEVTWHSDAEIDAGACTDGYSLQGLLTRILIRSVGLGPSCADGLDCSESAIEATNYWEMSPCDSSLSSLATDDIYGLRNMYGPHVEMSCAPALDPIQSVTCTAETYDAQPYRTIEWDFGDGTPPVTGTETPPTHSYAVEGAYTVQVCASWADCAMPTCGSTTVVALAPGTVEGSPTAPDTGTPPADEAGGCATTPAPAPSLLATLAALSTLRLRRRR